VAGAEVAEGDAILAVLVAAQRAIRRRTRTRTRSGSIVRTAA
jgi:hypothetical protein